MISVGLSGRTLLLILLAYLLGSIPFGLILARLFAKADVRQAGSGNIGATNVARVAGALPGTLTLLLDTAKEARVKLPALETVDEIYELSSEEGWDDLDYAATIQLLERWAGLPGSTK